MTDALPLVKYVLIFGAGGDRFYSVCPTYTESEIHAFYDNVHNDYVHCDIGHGRAHDDRLSFTGSNKCLLAGNIFKP